MSRPRKQGPASAPPRRWRVLVSALCVSVAVAGLIALRVWKRARSVPRPSSGQEPGAIRPVQRAVEDEQSVFARYAGSESCRDCHEEEFELWKTSHHALAERPVEAPLDRVAFDPSRSFRHGTQSTTVRWTNGTAEVTCLGLSGEPETHTVARVIGDDPLRQFLVPFAGGRYQALEASYDPRSNQWFNVYGEEDRKPGEWGHWTGRGMNWNYMCADCHNTRLRRNYDAATDTYHTTMAEMSVGCEACHGPLKAHNEWQKQFGRSGRKDPTVQKPSRQQILDYCGFCHARREELTGDFRPGDRFADDFALVTVDHSDRYYADGQVRDEDYEYGSFLGSRMHLRGVYCLDCHDPHSYKTILPGNWLCLRCHDGSNTNAPVINPSTHSHHLVYGFDTNGHPANVDLTAYKPKQIRETGGECVNCHMPQTAYMQRHWRHDHGFTSPDPLLTSEYGIPNACNRCHRDKDTNWALKFCDAWYGSKMDRPARRRAEAIGRARQGDPASRDALLELLHAEESPYWRAVALTLLASWAAQPPVTAAALSALADTNALVRAAAARTLEGALNPAATQVDEALRARLADPVRSVRVAAAWSLRATLDPSSPAGMDLRQYLENNADEPVGQMQLGVYAFSRNELESALAHFQKAVAWDPYSPPFHQELAVVFSALNRPRDAVATLEQACRLAPRDAESHFQLGLAYNEAGDLKAAAAQLAAATQLDPRHAAAWYNLGLAQNALGQTESALDALLRAEAVAPDNPRIPYARATILARLGRRHEALQAARRALEIDPSYSEARQLLRLLSN